PDAPVEVIAYEDFQCSHCQRFNQEVKSSIMSDLVAPGLATFEFRHRFVIGPDSVRAGAAAECAADQGRFWEYHDALFAALIANPRAVNSGDFKNLASQIGLDTAAFNQCVDSDTHIEKMLREDNEARNAGVNATPTILINGQRYQDAFTPEAFKAAVEAAAGGR
ncbi:MAG: thioredoxin domain-containing protein, partial [Caldilineales bacterium]|nr:thioredoxin domain-containing protein [Caldilineales bacterium]